MIVYQYRLGVVGASEMDRCSGFATEAEIVAAAVHAGADFAA